MTVTPLSEAEKTDVRRFCGYPPAGAGHVGPLGAAEVNARGPLEFRLANLSQPEVGIVRRYVSTITLLEVAVPRAAENLDTDQAAMWTHNRGEVKDRLQLLDEWRRRLCGFLDVPPGPALRSNASNLVI